MGAVVAKGKGSSQAVVSQREARRERAAARQELERGRDERVAMPRTSSPDVQMEPPSEEKIARVRRYLEDTGEDPTQRKRVDDATAAAMLQEAAKSSSQFGYRNHIEQCLARLEESDKKAPTA